ncbi:MAG TPA: glycosyltransferase family 87 protein [Candidatus Dormibacteraeota bacterium]
MRYRQNVTISRRTWLWVALAVPAVALALDVWFHPMHLGGGFSIDFHTYLAAARVGLQSGWAHLYDQALVSVEQQRLVPYLKSQPFLSPPGVAWLVAPLTPFPYWVAYWLWAAFTFAAFAVALAWSGVSTGISRWIAVLAALSPWWVLHAVSVGQVVPLVAAGVVVAWRLLREEKDIAAGIVLSVIFLKPNTAVLAPFALLVAGRYRAFAAWIAAGGLIGLIALLTIGIDGMSSYVNQLLAPLPSGADSLTFKGALGVTGVAATVLRVVVVGIALLAAFKLRASPGLVLSAGIVGTLIVAPYLHGSDLCLLSAAAWIVWEERTALAWRIPLAAGWLLASPYPLLVGLGPNLNRMPLMEYALLLALLVVAWRPLTGAADSRTRAPA